jgi:hypothetical protein
MRALGLDPHQRLVLWMPTTRQTEYPGRRLASVRNWADARSCQSRTQHATFSSRCRRRPSTGHHGRGQAASTRRRPLLRHGSPCGQQGRSGAGAHDGLPATGTQPRIDHRLQQCVDRLPGPRTVRSGSTAPTSRSTKPLTVSTWRATVICSQVRSSSPSGTSRASSANASANQRSREAGVQQHGAGRCRDQTWRHRSPPPSTRDCVSPGASSALVVGRCCATTWPDSRLSMTKPHPSLRFTDALEGGESCRQM